ncbi:MAG: alpha-ketoacid dehydrogenase subunit beta [Ignavibacteriales bacterium]
MREITYAQALNEALREEMKRDPAVFCLGEDIGVIGGNFGITKGLMQEFGSDRVIDTPISEEAIMGASLGAALTGMRPVPEIMFSSFLGCCWEPIWNQVTKIRYMSGGQVKVPLTIRTVNALGRSTAAQHLERPESMFMHMPGIKVVVPATPYDAKGLLKTAIRDDNPVIFFEQCFLYFKVKGPVPEEDYTIPFGKADIKRAGSDVTVVTYSMMVHRSLAAAERLAGDGIDCEVIDLRTLAPLDMQAILESIAKTGRLVIAEDDNKTAGAGAEIAARVVEEAFDSLDAPVVRVATMDVPPPFSPVMEQYIMPNEDKIVAAVKNLMNR